MVNTLVEVLEGMKVAFYFVGQDIYQRDIKRVMTTQITYHEYVWGVSLSLPSRL